MRMPKSTVRRTVRSEFARGFVIVDARLEHQRVWMSVAGLRERPALAWGRNPRLTEPARSSYRAHGGPGAIDAPPFIVKFGSP